MSAPKLALPPADILKSRHIQKIAPPGRSGCHLKISPTYNHMMPHRWRAFYLAIDFPFRFQCIAFFSDAADSTHDTTSERPHRSLFAPAGTRDDEARAAERRVGKACVSQFRSR